MYNQKLKIAYERLSRDDEQQGESNSITNQKLLLEEYAERNGFTNLIHLIDDGWSGTRWDRPGIVKLIEEVEAGKVGLVLVKDMSRLGRDHLRVGLLMEQFRERGVRFISVSDGVDTANGEDDFLPFRNILHEFYVRDTSRKIKAAFHSRGMSGKPTASIPPYGYLKSPEDRHKWIVDREAAEVIKRIYNLTMDGKGAYQICCILKEDKVPVPGYHLQKKGVGLHKSHVFPDPYNWSSSTICNILKKREYLGHLVNFKSKKNSYKDKRNHYVPESEWVIFENSHEPIIDQVTFDNVQRIRGNVKRRPDGWGYTHPLTGLLFCADCGGKLYCHRIYNGKDKPTYVCGNYAKGSAVIRSGIVCETGHRIDATSLMGLIKDTLKSIISFAENDKTAFENAVRETFTAKHTEDTKKNGKRLIVCEQRTAEIETLYKKIYEDNALGKLPDKRFAMLSAEYENEQIALEKEISELKVSVAQFEDSWKQVAKFTALIKRYADFEEMTVTMLNEFVEKIVVHERAHKSSIDIVQNVEIHFNFIGEFIAPIPNVEIDPAVLAEQEEEQRKIAERKKRLRQNYQKRKANGKQKEWEQKYEKRRKALKAEKRAVLLAEGLQLGKNATAV
ncbi:MAG: recombinase family protein [Oscillospiraceae bacterium]|nr:recombinase family protein [Oscillospiraceae bacterium]